MLNGQSDQAIQILEGEKEEYGEHNRLLYLLDQGMVFHLAGRYVESNAALEKAYQLVEDQYATRIRDEAKAILINETQLPYEGEPFEHVWINIIKALNFAVQEEWEEGLVEARRLDHRLNVLYDDREDDEYREDPFARYLSGVLYEAFGDRNNAYVAYRKAEQAYEDSKEWSKVSIPDMLKRDLFRLASSLGISEDRTRYQNKYSKVIESDQVTDGRAQIVLISFEGQGPEKEDLFIDVPISLEALQLVAIAKGMGGPSTRRTRGRDAFFYGIHGRVARVALPRVIQHRSSVAARHVYLTNENQSFESQTEEVYDMGAVAKKNLDDHYESLVLRAAARAALKLAAAEGVGYGARAAVKDGKHQWVGLVVTLLARIVAFATEEADIRSWRLLPGKIQMARLWVPPGSYAVQYGNPDAKQSQDDQAATVILEKDEVRVLLQYQRR